MDSDLVGALSPGSLSLCHTPQTVVGVSHDFADSELTPACLPFTLLISFTSLSVRFDSHTHRKGRCYIDRLCSYDHRKSPWVASGIERHAWRIYPALASPTFHIHGRLVTVVWAPSPNLVVIYSGMTLRC